MPSIRQSIRSSTASKRPTSAIADGQIALNTASGTPGIFFKDNANNIIKAGPAHYGASAPNSSPAVGGSTGNSIGEAWLDSSLTPAGWKIWNGSAWVNATPLSSDTVQGLVELATDAEVQAGVDTARAVTAAGLQSKVSDSISTTSSSGIASSSAVKTAYDLANAALPKSGGIITGNLEIGSTGSFTFEGATADGFETTLAVVDPTADRTITFPDITGTVITTADTGTVTSTMIANGTIVDADINSSAAIAFSKLASLASANILIGNASGVPTSTTVSGDVTITNAGVTAITSNVIVNADINSAAAIAYSKLALASGIVNTDISASAAVAYSKLALSNSIVNADINSAAAIAGTKISPDFGSQNLTTTGNITATNHIAASGTATIPSIQVGNGTTYKPGVYSPGTDQVAISTNGSGRLFVDASGNVGIGATPNSYAGYSTLTINNTTGSELDFELNGTLTSDIYTDSAGTYWTTRTAVPIVLRTNSIERLRITSAGNVGIGTTSPSSNLHVSAASGTAIKISETNNGVSGSLQAGSTSVSLGTDTNHSLNFYTNAAERARIDSSGRLLVGTSSARANFFNSSFDARLQVEGITGNGSAISAVRNSNDTDSPILIFGKSRGATLGSNTIVQNNATPDILGYISFQGNDGTEFVESASIKSEVDGTPGANDMPGRLVFSTTADGASSPTERMRITNGGNVGIGTTTPGANHALEIGGSQKYLSVTPNTGASGGVNPSSSSGLHFGWNRSNGDGEGNLIYGVGVGGAPRLSIASWDGTTLTERMKIDNIGRTEIGHGSAADVLILRNSNNSFTSALLSMSTVRAAGTSCVFFYATANNVNTFNVFNNGNVTNTNNSYGAISDIKLKENIVDANSQWDDLKALQVRNYNFKEGQTHTQIGLVAQEVELISPGLVTESPDRDENGNDLGTVTKSVNYSVLYMKAVKALQEAMERIEALEASNADLLARVTALEAA
jgi:hypothetical protein